MPGMSGLELVKIVRREFPATLRMLLTGAGTMDRAIEAINEGEVHRFFTKPFDFELFLATMKRLAERIEKLRGATASSIDLDERAEPSSSDGVESRPSRGRSTSSATPAAIS